MKHWPFNRQRIIGLSSLHMAHKLEASLVSLYGLHVSSFAMYTSSNHLDDIFLGNTLTSRG